MMKSTLLRQLEDTKRNLQEVTSRINSTEKLIEDNQAKLNRLRDGDEETASLKSKLQSVEESTDKLLPNDQEAVNELQKDLAEKNNIISELEKHLEDLQRRSVISSVKSDTLDLDHFNLQNQHELLQDELNSLINTVNEAEKLLNEDLKRYEDLKKELNEVRGSLTQKKNELSEKNEHIDLLKEEILAVNTQTNFIQPVVDQKECTPTSTSLFSEVNDRRITTQQTFNSIKSGILNFGEKQGRLQKKLSQLQCEVSKLKQLHNSSAQILEDCEAPLKNSLKSQLRMLKDLSKIHEEKLKAQEETMDNCSTYKLFDQAIKVVEAEVKLFDEKLSKWYLSEHMFSSSLFKINQETEKLQKTIEMLETINNRNKSQTTEENSVFDEVTIDDDNQYLQSQSRRCLEAGNKDNQGEEVTSRFEGITLIRGSDHKYSADLINGNLPRNVRFAENTVSRDHQRPNSTVSRGRKVFVLPKKIVPK